MHTHNITSSYYQLNVNVCYKHYDIIVIREQGHVFKIPKDNSTLPRNAVFLNYSIEKILLTKNIFAIGPEQVIS